MIPLRLFTNNIEADKIRKYRRLVTEEPSVGGNPESSSDKKYNVLLSYPDTPKANYLSVFDSEEHTLYRSDGVSPVVIPENKGLKVRAA
jgi:hypothetical protein